MRVVCDCIAPATTGGWAILRVTSVNDEAREVAWPVRLHPGESTVSFIVDGVRHRGAEQVDSMVETTVLQPGQALSTGVLVSVSDRGIILRGAGDVQIQLAVRPPASNDELLSNLCLVPVITADGDEDDRDVAADFSSALKALAAAAEESDASLVEASLASFGAAERAWIATAMLPAAPMPDHVVLSVATAMDTADDDDQSPLARAIIGGVPYPYDNDE